MKIIQNILHEDGTSISFEDKPDWVKSAERVGLKVCPSAWVKVENKGPQPCTSVLYREQVK